MITRVTVGRKSVAAKDIDGELLLDSQDLDSVRDYFGNRARLEDITGAIVKVGDGDYSGVYVTYDRAPYLNSAKYYRVTLTLYSRKAR